MLGSEQCLSVWFFFWYPHSAPLCPSLCQHPLHRHVCGLLNLNNFCLANAFNGKISLCVAPNGAVAKVSFCLVLFRFVLFCCFSYGCCCCCFALSAFRLFKYSLSLSKRPMSRLLLLLRLRPWLGAADAGTQPFH